MTPAQLAALNALRSPAPALTAAQIAEITPHVDARSDGDVARLLSVGRTALVPHIVTERGARAALSITDGALLMSTLKDAAAASPPWLAPVLGALGVPAGSHTAYADALACGYPWMRSDGVDLGSPMTRSLLDLMAAGVPALSAARTTLKALAEREAPLSVTAVSAALNSIGA